jgi:hypothetical protein
MKRTLFAEVLHVTFFVEPEETLPCDEGVVSGAE